MPGVLIGVVGVFGLLIGSFLNVVIHRVPLGLSVVSPPSSCPSCGARIRPWHNVPVVSWLVLRGRCHDCSAPIPVRYPLVEAGTGVLFALTAWWAGPSWALPAYLYLAAVGLALALIDLRTRRLPNAIVLPSYPVAAALLALASWGTGDWSALGRASISGVALFVVYFLMVLIYPAGMGFGDVKLAGLLGAYLGWVGWGALVVGAFAAFLVGGVFGLVLIVAGRAGRKTGIPFGPWMILGAAIGLVWGEGLWATYLGAFAG